MTAVATLPTPKNSEEAPKRVLSKAESLANFNRADFDTYRQFLRLATGTPEGYKFMLSYSKGTWGDAPKVALGKKQGSQFGQKMFDATPAGDDAVWEFAKTMADRPIYANVALREEGLPSWARGKLDETAPVRVLCMDLDVRSDTNTSGHKEENLPSLAEVEAGLAAFQWPPALVVHTGGGLHAYWLLSEAPTDLDADGGMRRAFVEFWKGYFTELGGYKTDSVTMNRASLLRLPGTTSGKRYGANPYAPVHITSYAPEAVIPTDDMLAFLAENAPAQETRKKGGSGRASGNVGAGYDDRRSPEELDLSLPGTQLSIKYPLHKIALAAYDGLLAQEYAQHGIAYFSWADDPARSCTALRAHRGGDGVRRMYSWSSASAEPLGIKENSLGWYSSFDWLCEVTEGDLTLATKLAKRFLTEGLESAAAFMLSRPSYDDALEKLASAVVFPDTVEGPELTQIEPAAEPVAENAEVVYSEGDYPIDVQRDRGYAVSGEEDYEEYEAPDDDEAAEMSNRSPDDDAVAVAAPASVPASKDGIFTAAKLKQASALELTDLGFGARIGLYGKGRFAFHPSLGWHEYEDGVWRQKVGTAEINAFARKVTTTIMGEVGLALKENPRVLKMQAEMEAASGGDEKVFRDAERAFTDAKKELRTAYRDFYKQLANGVVHIKASVEASTDSLGVAEHLWTDNPRKLNCANGVVDLETGALAPHDYRDYLTRMTPVNYLPDATHVDLDTVLEGMRASAGDEIPPFLRRWYGQASTGLMTGRSFLFMGGEQGAGKTSLMVAVNGALGNGFSFGYAATADPSIFSKRANRDGKRDDLHSFMGLRNILCDEAEDGIIDAATMKRLTSGASLRTRALFGQFTEWTPNFKIGFAANDAQGIPGEDAAFMRRFLYIHMEKTVSMAKVDGMLLHRLQNGREQHEATLAWMVKGAMEWLAAGGDEKALGVPDAIRTARAELAEKQDELGRWLEDLVVPEGSRHDSVTMPALQKLYTRHQKEQGTVYPLAPDKFRSAMERRGYVAPKSPSYGTVDNVKKSGRWVSGLGLNIRDAGIEVVDGF